MIDPKHFGPDVDLAKISPDATILGESYLTGAATRVEAGAVIENSRLDNVTVEAGAKVVDSIVTVERPIRSHKCDAAGHFVAAGTDRPTIGEGATVQSSTLINTSVEADATITHCWISNSRVGERNRLDQVKMILCHVCEDVSLQGPTEFSESYIGDHLSVDRCGFFEAVFSNTFHVLDFDPDKKELVVRETIELPHTSRYGQNVICSTNSGRLRPSEDGEPLRSFGPRVRLWHDKLLSHELIRVEPCCWVSDWTKLIGESARAYETDVAMMNDRQATLVMPFAVAGFDGDATRGLVMPGERAVGVRPHQRFPVWTFTYAPGAVIAMVRRVYDLLPPERREVVDTLVAKSLETARAMVRATRKTIWHDEHEEAWHAWVDRAEQLLDVHEEADLWRFEGGRPCEWSRDKATGRWVHPRQERLLELAPDLLEEQVSEEQLTDSTLARSRATDSGDADMLARSPATGMPSNPPQTAGLTEDNTTELTSGSTSLSFAKRDAQPTVIDPTAKVADDAVVGPGCLIGPEVVIGSGVQLWNATLYACTVGDNSRIERCEINGAEIGAETTLRSSTVQRSRIGSRSTVETASIVNSSLADLSTISALADLDHVATQHGTILGGRFEWARIDTCLMSMHVAGRVSNVWAKETLTKTEDGQMIYVKAIPMIGGGSRCEGTTDSPIEMEGCFIGSNARIKHGVRIGFGSFVLGRIGPDVELLPFTLAFGGDPTTYRIGEVLTRLPEVVISHFLGWTYQASTPEELEAVTQVVETSIQRAIIAICVEQARRSGVEEVSDWKNHDLSPYSDDQLRRGFEVYQKELDSGRWRMAVEAGELVFCR